MTFARNLSYFVIAFTVALTAFTVHKAYGQKREMFAAICMPVEVFDKAARERFKEAPVAQGEVVEGANYIVLYQRADKKSFSIAAIAVANNQACVIASGNEWKQIKDNRSDL